MENIYVSVVPHREFLPANKNGQKFFLMLKIRPTQEVAISRPSTNFAFVIDTSGSMYEVVGSEIGNKSKIDIVIESLQALIGSGKLSQSDSISIIQFDDQANTLLPLTSGTEVQELNNAINRLKNFSGGTRMGLGMGVALKILSNQTMSSRRTLIFTDGQTFDEDVCKELAQKFAVNNIPITALGIGDYEENLLIHLSDTTGGRVLHVAPENNHSTAISIKDLPNQIIDDFSQAQQSVITNLALTVKAVKGVELTRVARAYPELAEFPLAQQPLPLGNATANEETIFLLEFTAEGRPPSRVRLAQIGLTYDVPGKNRRGELPPQDVVVQFMEGQMGAAVNQEVNAYLQQCNIAGLMGQLTKIADTDPVKTKQILATVRNMTIKIGNQKMTRLVEDLEQELNSSGTISSDTRKTVQVGSKGGTVHWNGDPNFDEDSFRNISGT